MHLRFTALRGVTVLLLALTAVPIGSVGAQKPRSAPADADADARAVYNYKLTEAGLKKYATVVRSIASAAEKDPSVATQFKGKRNDDDAQTLAGLAANFDRVPAVKRAINDAGMSSLELATFIMASIQASIVYGMMEAPEPYRVKEIPKDISKANVDFVRAHHEELTRLQKEFEAAGKKNHSTGPGGGV
jgi:hypothetical protein